jgi:hypothetical protein
MPSSMTFNEALDPRVQNSNRSKTTSVHSAQAGGSAMHAADTQNRGEASRCISDSREENVHAALPCCPYHTFQNL